MALVDWEAVVLDFQGHIRSKNSHGQRELTDKLADLIVQHRQVEGLPEKALRLYGPELHEILSNHPDTDEAVAELEMGAALAPSK